MKLNLPFDKIYLLNLAERPDRLEYMNKQFDYFGIKDQVILHEAVKHTWSADIANFFSKNNMELKCGGAFNCTFEHYSIIKNAYIKGYNSIMVIEDDCSFYKDIDVLQKYFDNLPEDWDILRIAPLRGRTEQKHFEEEENKNKLWDKVFIGMWGTGCYALNRNGMKYMIDAIDNKMQPIDHPLFNYNELNNYMPNIPIGLCMSNDSDIILNCQYHKDIIGLDKSLYEY